MQFHTLPRGPKLALVLLLSLAVILPLIALMPSYLTWKERQAAERSIEQSYTASVSDTL
jgi:hypothetical protein